MPQDNTRKVDDVPDQHHRVLYFTAAVLIVIAAFALRMRGSERVMRGDGTVAFSDLDTMRRLARLQALDAADTYPIVEKKDGYPGTVSHWTKPFDWVLRVLDPLAAPFVTGARTYEAAAVLAGPLLGAICVVLFLGLASQLLGALPALCATAFYAVQFPLLNTNAVGNGDHQNLQHVFLLAFAWLWLLSHGHACRRASVASGIALGLGIWVSTETMVIFLSWVAITGVLLVLSPRTNLRALAGMELGRGVALILTLLVGLAVEQGSLLAIQWDKISWFQIYPAAVFILFLVLCRWIPPWRGGAVIAALVALSSGLLGLLTGLGAAVQEQLAAFDHANIWLQTSVNEFRSSFWDGTGYSLGEAMRRFTYALPTLPVFLFAAARARHHCWQVRAVLVALTTITFGLAAWEVKLGHLFAILYPVTLVVGGMQLRDALLPETGRGRFIASTSFTLILVALGIFGLPKPPVQSTLINQEGVRELCGFLSTKEGSVDHSVMAPWSMGAPLMYLADWPVVASGYHRNIEGILDGYRFFTSQPNEGPQVQQILQRRSVRFVVAWYSRAFLLDAQRVLQSRSPFMETLDGKVRFTELATNSLFWRLRYADAVPGFRLVYKSKIEIRLGGTETQPLFKVFAVR